MKQSKTFLHIILAGALLTSFWGCSHHDSESNPSPSESKHAVAARMKATNEPLDKIIAVQKEALEDLRKGRSPESGYEILSQLGYFECRAGNFMDGLRYLQEAADSLATMSEDSVDITTVIKFYGNLSNLYTRIGLYHEAKENNELAVSLAKEKESDLLPDLYRMKGSIYEKEEKLDSVIYYDRLALKAANSIKDERYRNNAKVFNENAINYFYIEHPDFAIDSIPHAIASLMGNMGKYPINDATSTLLAGRGYVLTGHPDIGIPMMEKAVAAYREEGGMENLEFGLSMLAQSYAETDNPKLDAIYLETTAMHDTMARRLRNDVLLGKDYQFRATELRAENELLESQLALTRQRIFFVAIFILIVVVAVGMLYFQKRRNHRAQLKDRQEAIDALIAERMALNSKIESLNAAIKEGAKENHLPEYDLPSVILEKEDEMRFRKYFIDIHPGFLELLRRDYPGLTSGNELLCMLIALRRSNDDIALALGISKESVATARYRLRSRFALPKETDLNTFIQGRL